MLLLDVNVLVAAYRDDHPDHQPVRQWFDGLLASPVEFCVPASVWASFLRVVTNRRIFAVPASAAQALDFADSVCAQPRHTALGPGPRHLAILRRMCAEADAVGDLVPDAVLAALAVEHASSIVSLDRDFARFPSVDHRLPHS